MPDLIENRRVETNQRLEQLRAHLADASARVTGKACIYLTGSFARAEATGYSDLDLFIVGRDESVEGRSKRALSRLDEICVKADLIKATRTIGIQEFSGDGEYLIHYTIGELVKTLGKPEDDANNTFTARMLLLLESRALLNDEVRAEAVDQVLAAYWRDFADHQESFIPGFLANDILRMWRTFCVNYEARTQTDPEDKKAKRKLKNYKLKHSRLLTCYSALASLSAEFSNHGTVPPDAAKRMVDLSPTERLEAISRNGSRDVQRIVGDILSCYEAFLAATDASEATLVDVFLDSVRRKAFPDPSKLGDSMAALLNQLGQDSRFHRLLLV